MRQHDEHFEHKVASKFGSEKRLLRGAVNNEPLDLKYKKSDYLAAEERLLDAARMVKLKRKDGSPLKTKTNLRVIESIERRKDEEFLASEEKRLRLQRKREFSEQVRDSFLPATVVTGQSKLNESGFSSDGYSRRKAGQSQREQVFTLDVPHLQARTASKQSTAVLRAKEPSSVPRTVKLSSEWVAKVLEPDKEESKMADVYEVAFSSLF